MATPLKLTLFVVAAIIVIDLGGLPATAANPPWPWIPTQVPCEFDYVNLANNGPKCNDCNSVMNSCTPQGGWLRNCIAEGSPYCVNGQCVKEPGPGCAKIQSAGNVERGGRVLAFLSLILLILW